MDLRPAKFAIRASSQPGSRFMPELKARKIEYTDHRRYEQHRHSSPLKQIHRDSLATERSLPSRATVAQTAALMKMIQFTLNGGFKNSGSNDAEAASNAGKGYTVWTD
jgi:hypothetical protein